MQTTPLREQHLFGRSRRLPADRDQTMTRDIPGFSGTTGMPIRTGAQPRAGIGRQNWTVPAAQFEVRLSHEGRCPGSAPPRTTKPGSRDDHQDTGRHLTPAAPSFLGPALRARGTRLKSPKNPRLPLHDPGVRAPARRGGGGGSLERTRLATNLGKCPQSVASTPVPPSTMTSRVVGMAP